MTARLAEKNVMVVGGASGMGECQVARFIREGARVIVADLNEERGKAVAERAGSGACFVKLDVRSEEDWANALKAAEAHCGGPLDAMVNNAGVLIEEALEETSLDSFRFQSDVMQVGVFLGMRTLAPSLRKAGGGALVNISSTAGMSAYPKCFGYVAAKFAVRGMTKAAALELAPDKIRVNSIHPHNTDTPMIAGKDYPIDDVPLRRNATVDEIASLALYLISDESQFTTGAEHIIDGGFLAM